MSLLNQRPTLEMVSPEPDPLPPQPSLLGSLRGLALGLRPKQATKNLFLFAAYVFAGRMTSPTHSLKDFFTVCIAFLLFTLTAGSIYLLNDLLDVKQDRQHPEKRKRPIASGVLPVPLAWTAFALFSIGSLAFSFAFHIKFGIVIAIYFVMQLAYCFYLKRLVLVDVFTISLGFVLRTVAGGVIINVTISQWLLLCTFLLALFLGFGKRRQELIKLGENAGKHRAILSEYSIPFLEQMINIVAGITIVCYSVYSIESETAHKHPHLWVTVPFVIYGVCRYLYLVHQKGWGGAPDEALLKDRMLQVTIILWFLTVVTLFLVDKPGVSLIRL